MPPQTTRPVLIPVKDSGSPGQNGGSGVGPAADIGWRNFFADPRRQRLISIALENNRDLRIATLNVEDMRAKYQIQRSTLFPTVDALANSTTLQQPRSLQYAGEPSTIYSVGVGVTSYELDFFGRVRSLKDQALRQYFSTGQAGTHQCADHAGCRSRERVFDVGGESGTGDAGAGDVEVAEGRL